MPPNERLSDPRGLKWVCAATEDNISWESVENGTKRLGTKETCQICEPRQTGYRLIPSRPCKWGKEEKKKKRNTREEELQEPPPPPPMPDFKHLHISFLSRPTRLHSASNHPFPQTNQTGCGGVMPSSLTLSSGARRVPAIIGSYWSHWSGRSPHLGPHDPIGVSFHPKLAVWPRSELIRLEINKWI